MEEVRVEIRAGEGGGDARLFAAELACAYARQAEAAGWSARAEPEPDRRAGNQMVTVLVRGRGAHALRGEAGGHRVQRVPEGERRGRVHSSTVTVAVLCGGEGADDSAWHRRDEADFRVEWFNGTVGAGGQFRNKTATAARVTHVPTGLVRTAQSRSRRNSLDEAMAALARDLDRGAAEARSGRENALRRGMTGSGERSDKRRTWRFRDDLVHDHVTGRSASCSRVMRGDFSALWGCAGADSA